MTPEQFAYWLQGFAEMAGATPTDEQWKMIREHLGTVFLKVTNPLTPAPRSKLEEAVEALRKSKTVSPDPWPGFVPPRFDTPKITC